MEQSDFVRDIFRDVPKEQLKQEIKNQEFTEEYKNFSVIIRNDIMRRDPSSKGEVIAFLDVGDVVEVLDIYNNWVYIRVEVGDDIETGWIVKGVSQSLKIREI
jgi:SH3-like domain-containing protein